MTSLTRWLVFSALADALFLFADITEHIRMNVQSDVGHVVEMFAGDKPDDLANLALGVIIRHTSKLFGVSLLIFCQLRYIVQSRALSIVEQRAGAVLFKRVEFGLIHRCL